MAYGYVPAWITQYRPPYGNDRTAQQAYAVVTDQLRSDHMRIATSAQYLFWARCQNLAELHTFCDTYNLDFRQEIENLPGGKSTHERDATFGRVFAPEYRMDNPSYTVAWYKALLRLARISVGIKPGNVPVDDQWRDLSEWVEENWHAVVNMEVADLNDAAHALEPEKPPATQPVTDETPQQDVPAHIIRGRVDSLGKAHFVYGNQERRANLDKVITELGLRSERFELRIYLSDRDKEGYDGAQDGLFDAAQPAERPQEG